MQHWIATSTGARYLIAALVSGVIVVLARKGWYRLALGLLVVGVVGLALSTSAMSLNGWHGQMHWAYARSAVRGTPAGVPFPEDPMFAGQALMYPWTPHWVLGKAADVTGLSPVMVLCLCDVLWLVLLVVGAGWVVLRCTGRRDAATIAGFLALTGWQVHEHNTLSLIRTLGSVPVPDLRAIPLDKFFNPNLNPLGLGMTGLGVVAMLMLLRPREGGGGWWWGAVAAFAALVSAFGYPLSYVALALISIGLLVVRLIASRKLFDDRALLACACVGEAGLWALPHLLTIDGNKVAQARIAISTASRMLEKGLSLATWSGLALLLVLIFWRSVREAWSGMIGGAWLFVSGLVVLSVAHVVLAVPLTCEYKFLGASAMLWACLLAPALGTLSRRFPMLAIVALTLVSLGAAGRVQSRLSWPKPMLGEVRSLWARNPEVRDPVRMEMLRAIVQRTHKDCVVVTDDPLVATIADRSLYFPPPRLGTLSDTDGWSMKAGVLEGLVIGHDPLLIAERERVWRELMAPKDAESARVTIAIFKAALKGRQGVIVCRNSRVGSTLTAAGASYITTFPCDEAWGLVVVK